MTTRPNRITPNSAGFAFTEAAPVLKPIKSGAVAVAAPRSPAPPSSGQAVADTDTASLLAQLAQARAENERLKAQAANAPTGGLPFKLNACGTLSFYGFGQRPISAYTAQWKTLLAKSAEILAFISSAEEAGKVPDKATSKSIRERLPQGVSPPTVAEGKL